MKSLAFLLIVLMFAGWSEAGPPCKSKHKLFIKTVQRGEVNQAIIEKKDFCGTYFSKFVIKIHTLQNSKYKSNLFFTISRLPSMKLVWPGNVSIE